MSNVNHVFQTSSIFFRGERPQVSAKTKQNKIRPLGGVLGAIIGAAVPSRGRQGGVLGAIIGAAIPSRGRQRRPRKKKHTAINSMKMNQTNVAAGVR